ncbi:hypothetical protein MILUP08_42701 [Micromonospora lupini str. Lupac 08]|uniref:Uncharacterized protein n=1 Tax=Micromonospora lupini str. Lupac 08 TaxID=1150864 RepID=I0L1S3_9ACTN|nr:hypothetical protein MILUP08_42701 [Micromonospora lupini str. Lupac 08]
MNVVVRLTFVARPPDDPGKILR